MTKKQHYLTYPERIRIEEKLRYHVPVAEIARELGVTRQTIYNEIKRGEYDCIEERHGYYYDVKKYSADKGQQIFEQRQLHKGRELKIGNDIAYANFLECKILHEHFSPAAALASAKKEGFITEICVNTLYNYINNGIFLKLTNIDLLEKTSRKPQKKKEDNQPKKAHENLPSIEERPIEIQRREEYGHWEMDLVVSCEGSKAVLLTLTERKTRQEMIFKLPNRKAKSVRKVFNNLERKLPNFKEIFKSITTDNGSEFMEYEKLRRSIHGGKRFQIWYCHSYAAWEKGSNENHNRMIRRFFPKGTDFAKVSPEQIAELESWMNHYPRRILGWLTPLEAAA